MTSRKEEILRQAMDLVIRDGIAALTMKHVAQQVGFTEAAMYRHFRSKRELVISLIGMIHAQFDQIFTRTAAQQTPDIFFRNLLRPMLGYLEKVRGVTFQFLSESTYNRDEQIRTELNGFYSGLLERVTVYLEGSRQRGEIRPEVNCEAAAILFTGIIQSLTIRYLLSGQSVNLQEKGDEVLDVYLRGVLA